MGAEHTPVAVHLVDNHEGQGLEKLGPLGVVGQYGLVEHVRVGDHDVAPGTHGLAGIPRGVPIEGKGLDAERSRPIDLQELGHLVLCQRLGRIQVQGLAPFRQYLVENRKVVAESLAGGGGRGDDQVTAAAD
jgi:hypothetical protein